MKRPLSISVQAEHTPQGSERNPCLAVERFGQDARNCRLANAPGASKQVGMMQPFLIKGVGKRPDHVILSGQINEALGTPFAGENLSLRHDI